MQRPINRGSNAAKLVLLCIILLSIFLYKKVDAATTINGAMWSSTIGWIDTSGLILNDNVKTITGTAWSSNIGWVSFNASDILGKCPAGAVSYDSTGNLSGYARAISGSDSQGWDGCINFGTTQGGAKYDLVTGVFSGAAWGDVNVGWLDLSRLKTSLTTSSCVGSVLVGGTKCAGTNEVPSVLTQWSPVIGTCPTNPYPIDITNVCKFYIMAPTGSCATSNPPTGIACPNLLTPPAPNTPWSSVVTCLNGATNVCKYTTTPLSSGTNICKPQVKNAGGVLVDVSFANIGQEVTWTAVGAGPYLWSGDGVIGSPTGSAYKVRYQTIGNKKVSLNGNICTTDVDGEDPQPYLRLINNPNFHEF